MPQQIPRVLQDILNVQGTHGDMVLSVGQTPTGSRQFCFSLDGGTFLCEAEFLAFAVIKKQVPSENC